MFDFDELDDALPLSAAPRRPRVLCLHGTAGSASIFETQLAALRKSCGDIELIFVDGPLVCKEDNPQRKLMGLFFPGQVLREFAEATLDDRGWRTYSVGTQLRDAMTFVEKQLVAHAPIDGILGFSQGCNLATLVAARAALGEGPRLQFVIHMCGSKPGWVADHEELFAKPLQLAAMVVRAREDTVALGSEEIASFYASSERIEHPDKHRPLPADPQAASALCKQLHDFIWRHACCDLSHRTAVF